MSMKEYFKRRFALSDQGYSNLVLGSLSCMLHNLALMFSVFLLFLLVCDVMGDNSFDLDQSMTMYLIGCAAVMVLIAVTYAAEYHCTYNRVYTESGNVRTSLAEKIRKLPMSYFGKNNPTDTTNRMLNDVTQQEQALSHWFPVLIGAMVSVTVICIGVVIWSPVMGLAAVWPIPIAFVIVLTSKSVQKKVNRSKNMKALEVSEDLQEYLECMSDLKSNNSTDGFLSRMLRNMDTYERYQVKAEYTAAAFVVSASLLMKFGIVSVALVGSYLLVSGEVSFVVFLAFLFMVSRIYDPLQGALINLAAMISSEYNMERLQQMNDEPEQTGTTEFHPDGYDIEFDHVGFSYDKDAPLLKDVTFTAKQGEVTALIGPSGEGKSTLAKLSARFWDIDSGTIRIGGTDISTVDPETLLSCYSIVFQDVTLFNTTVMENIRIGRKGATDEEVMEAARLAVCDEFVSKMPEGYRTVIGENGSKLSGGERQRISIARAILKDAPVILLDEATASLDAECETQVQHALSKLVRGKTVLIVAHRMRTIENADRIVVLRNGTVAEQGRPDELNGEGSIFRRMVALQSDSESWSL